MGLDMYIFREDNKVEDGDLTTELAYWRKHPNLHGYIVKKFADGVDECQKIPLTLTNLEQILDATEHDRLPYTNGFFFGTSQPEDKQETLTLILRITRLMRIDPKLKVYYQASW